MIRGQILKYLMFTNNKMINSFAFVAMAQYAKMERMFGLSILYKELMMFTEAKFLHFVFL